MGPVGWTKLLSYRESALRLGDRDSAAGDRGTDAVTKDVLRLYAGNAATPPTKKREEEDMDKSKYLIQLTEWSAPRGGG